MEPGDPLEGPIPSDVSMYIVSDSETSDHTRSDASVLCDSYSETRSTDLATGLDEARACIAEGCPFWCALEQELGAVEGELIEVRARKEAKAQAKKDASKQASLKAAGTTGSRTWSCDGAEALALGLRKMHEKNVGLANAQLRMIWPPMESFSMPVTERGASREDEGKTRAPSGRTIGVIECAACGIRHSTRLHLMGKQSTLTCLCANVPADKFAFGGYRAPLTPEHELHNLHKIFAHYRPNYRVVTPNDEYTAATRIVNLECQTCKQRLLRAVGPRLVSGEVRCGCAVKRQRKV